MNEGRTTVIFLVVAVVALGLAWWSKPAPITNQDEIARSRQGEDVFLEFDDPAAAASLQIAQYDEELAQLKRFEVARDPQSNLWTLPSNDDYPADAAEQVKDATTPLVGLQILSVESDLRSDHETYGVVNPDDEALAAGASGVGMLITLKNDKDVVLASLIIGKEVDGTEGQRYVRIPTEDAVYVVELGVDAFSTNFRDWIEGELLDVRSFDITRIGVRDYDLRQQSLTTMALNRNFDAEVEYDSSESDWKLVSYQTYEGGSATPATLGEGESLNKEFLNAMRTAAQDLEIVDVKRKPTGLAADLKADESLLEDEQSISSLQTQGFYPAGGPDGTEIYAAGGETIVGTDAGVRYVLRFGEATASLSSIGDSSGEDSGLSRYLLVTARLEESEFPFPELEEAPSTVDEMLARERGDSDDPSEGDGPASGGSEAEPAVAEPAADELKSDESGAQATEADTSETVSETTGSASQGSEAAGKPEGADSEAAASAEDSDTSDSDAGDIGNDEADSGEPNLDDCQVDAEEQESGDSGAESGESDDAEEKQPVADEGESADDDSATEAESTSTEGQTATEGEADVKAAETADTDGEAATEDKPKETEEELLERLEAVREEIAKENQRKIDERNEKLDEARKKVQELNARFSEWYYVVSDGEYNKLKVTRENLIKTEDTAESITPGLGDGLNLPPGLQPSLQPQFP